MPPLNILCLYLDTIIIGRKLYSMICLTLHWPIFMNNPLIFVSFTLLYSRGVPVINNRILLISIQLYTGYVSQ